jgi:asparagine synthase (glutamine-hydrolysing)
MGKKRGFEIPTELWINRELRPFVQFFLSDSRLSKQGIFKSDKVSNLLNEHYSNGINHTRKIWIFLMFQLWYFVFVENNGAKPSMTLHDIL